MLKNIHTHTELPIFRWTHSCPRVLCLALVSPALGGPSFDLLRCKGCQQLCSASLLYHHLCCITRSFREKVAPDVSGFLSFSRSWPCDFLLPCLLPDTPESRASQVVLMITHLPMQQTRDSVSNPGSGRSAGGGHGNHSSILAWRRPWTEEPGGLQSMGSQRVEYT